MNTPLAPCNPGFVARVAALGLFTVIAFHEVYAQGCVAVKQMGDISCYASA
jgi:hypothetical protein